MASSATVTMNGNDIVEMESMTDTEEMEGDTDAGMIEEEVGETSLPFWRVSRVIRRRWMVTFFSLSFLNNKQTQDGLFLCCLCVKSERKRGQNSKVRAAATGL